MNGDRFIEVATDWFVIHRKYIKQTDSTTFAIIFKKCKRKITLENVKDLISHMNGFYATKKRFTLVIVTTNLAKFDSAYRKELKKWIDEHQDDAKKYIVVSKIVIRNWFIRQFLKMLFTFSKPAAPYKIYESSEAMVKDITVEL